MTRLRLPLARPVLQLVVILLVFGSAPPASVKAQSPEAVPSSRESFEIGLSSDQIGITSDFNGHTLTVFGAIGNTDMEIWRTQRYDIIVALFGPRRPVVVREKQRFFGIWINRDSELMPAAPVTYSIATTRELRDILPAETLRRLSLGIDTLRLDGRNPTLGQQRPIFVRQAKFEEALREIKTSRGLYTESIGGVDYTAAESTLFRADILLPAEISTGEHSVRAYLVKQGQIIAQQRENLNVRKVGFEAEIDRYASTHGFTYGLFAVLLAILTGWLGRVIFKRD